MRGWTHAGSASMFAIPSAPRAAYRATASASTVKTASNSASTGSQRSNSSGSAVFQNAAGISRERHQATSRLSSPASPSFSSCPCQLPSLAKESDSTRSRWGWASSSAACQPSGPNVTRVHSGPSCARRAEPTIAATRREAGDRDARGRAGTGAGGAHSGVGASGSGGAACARVRRTFHGTNSHRHGRRRAHWTASRSAYQRVPRASCSAVFASNAWRRASSSLRESVAICFRASRMITSRRSIPSVERRS